ncbi:MFS transporter [Solirubrobacter sp. CPCC 204708]|nr:MFS transporter [Solirubrobacter deserti]
MALVVVCLAQLMMVVDMTIVNVALPVIQRDLQFSQADLTWVVGAYLISYGSFLLLAGRLGDLLGRKTVFLAGTAIFTVASLACGLAESQLALIAARFAQGFGGAIATSVILALIATDFPRVDERVKAMGAYMFVVTSGGSLGLLLGGALVESVDWHWIFTVNVPIGIAVLVLGARLIENRPGLGLEQGVDVAGSILVTASMMTAVYAIITAAEHGWTSAHTLGWGGAAAILGAAFLYLQTRIKNPIFPLRILRVRTLIGASVVRGFLVTGMFGTWVMGSLYVEHVLGYGAWLTGLAFLPMTLIVGALSLGTTARVMSRLGPERTVVAGLVLVVGALTLLTTADVNTAYFPTLFAAFAVMGLGMGTAMLPLMTIAMSDVRPEDAGLGSGIINVSMQLAGALGIAILGTLASDRTAELTQSGANALQALTGGYTLAFQVAAGAVIVGIVIALVALRMPREREPVPGSEVAVEV